jgi:hypothetical protein
VCYEVLVEVAALGGVSRFEESASAGRAAIGGREDEARPAAGAMDAE